MNYVPVDVIKKEIEDLNEIITPDNEMYIMFSQNLLQKILKKQKSENIYYDIRHEILKEDARNFIADYMRDEYGVLDSADIDFSQYDIDYLVYDFEEREDPNISFNDTWDEVIRDYMYDFEKD